MSNNELSQEATMKGFLKSLLSRKLWIWVVATVALFMGLIEGWIWGGITAAYMGANLADWLIVKKDFKE